MRPKMTIEEKLKGHCYLRLEDGEQREHITADLLSKGIALPQIEAALRQAQAALDEYARYKNVELAKTLGGALIVAMIGIAVSNFVDDAPGRYRNMHVTIFMLAAAIAAYGIWARLQRV